MTDGNWAVLDYATQPFIWFIEDPQRFWRIKIIQLGFFHWNYWVKCYSVLVDV